MRRYLLLDDAEHRLDEIIDYSRQRWGEATAIRYVDGMIECFEQIAAAAIPWRAIPAEFEVAGHFCRYQRHFIHWTTLADGSVGIATILHERMHQMELVRNAFQNHAAAPD